MIILICLTPANKWGQTPSERVEPDQYDGHGGSTFGVPLHGLQGLGDDEVAVDGDGQQVYHRGDAKEGPTKGIHLTGWDKYSPETQVSLYVFALSSNVSCVKISCTVNNSIYQELAGKRYHFYIF